MTQYLYTDNLVKQNISFALAGKRALGNRRDLRDLSNHTVIIVCDETADASIMRETAEMILARGCKNVVFCGESDIWRSTFEEMDQELNGFNDVTGYDDFAVMWGIEDIDSLEDEVASCWNEVLILCSDMTLVKECREVLSSSIADMIG